MLRQRATRPIAMVLDIARVPLVIEVHAHLPFVTEYFQLSEESQFSDAFVKKNVSFDAFLY